MFDIILIAAAGLKTRVKGARGNGMAAAEIGSMRIVGVMKRQAMCAFFGGGIPL